MIYIYIQILHHLKIHAKKNKAPQTGPLGRESIRPMDSLHKGTLLLGAFPCYDVIMKTPRIFPFSDGIMFIRVLMHQWAQL